MNPINKQELTIECATPEKCADISGADKFIFWRHQPKSKATIKVKLLSIAKAGRPVSL
jgi:hypothetical protein